MKSSLDLLRVPVSLPLAEGEEEIKTYTASYDSGNSVFSSWKLGNLHLTTERLLFVQVRKILFQINLKDIQKMEIVKRRWILGKKVKQLYIRWESSRVRNVYIAVKNPQIWEEIIESLKR